MRLLILLIVILLLAACNETRTTEETEPAEAGAPADETEDTDSVEPIKTDNVESSYDTQGDVDVLSPAFYEDYLNNYYFHSYAGIERGMTRDEVTAILGEPTEASEDEKIIGERFNDLIVSYAFQEDSVEQILISPQEEISLDQIVDAYGYPTRDLAAGELGNPGRTLVYRPTADANFYISVVGNQDEIVRLIHHDMLQSAQVVNEENVMYFVNEYYTRNDMDVSPVIFEKPVLVSDHGYFEVPFVNHVTGYEGNFRVFLFGQIEFYDVDGEFIYADFIPYSDGVFK